ncbi:unnamed protein product [Aureobasidium uvarum]|uniref:Uncharacterized protein n=1 Tax=Aureobasidium uvarum TaxID=2773716 RepID=A0A9N8KN13_9PEZI|nr:unnamed protein product [Aureobasidium uvarum]
MLDGCVNKSLAACVRSSSWLRPLEVGPWWGCLPLSSFSSRQYTPLHFLTSQHRHSFLLIGNSAFPFDHLWKHAQSIVGIRSSLLSSHSIVRFFSLSNIKHTTKHDPEAPKKPWAKQLAARNARYRNDAAYRDEVLARNRTYRAEQSDRFKQCVSKSTKRRRQEDAAWCEQRRKYSLAMYKEKYTKDPTYCLRRRLQRWVAHHLDFMSSLPWKTHRPLYYPEKVRHFCQGCNGERLDGLRSGWVRLDQDTYDCPSCYVQDNDAAMPKGYEAITTWKDLIARNKELTGLAAKGQSRP